jgi:hypothetical protein
MQHSQLSDVRDRFDRRAFCKAAGLATAVGVIEASLAGCGKTRLRLIMLSRFGDYVAKGRVLVASAAA